MGDLVMVWNNRLQKMSEPFNPFQENTVWFDVNEEHTVLVSEIGYDPELKIVKSTGATDVQGKPIFDRSIVQVPFHKVLTWGVVRWDASQFTYIIEWNEGFRHSLRVHSHLEVVGNEWESPDVVAVLKYPREIEIKRTVLN